VGAGVVPAGLEPDMHERARVHRPMRMKPFEALDAEVLGVSVDSVWSHKAYADKMGINIRCWRIFIRAER